MKVLTILFCLCAATSPVALTGQVSWYSALDYFNFASDDRVMDASFRFELGVFRDGFVPTAQNQDAWSAHWVPAQRENYNETNGWYSGYVVVEDNEAPFTVGAEAWVWGFSGNASGGDWILFRSTGWRWPRANPTSPIANHWNAKDADTVLIGTVSAAPERLLQAAAVRNRVPPTTTFAQWTAENRRGGSSKDMVDFVTGGERPPVRLMRSAAENKVGIFEVRLARLADRQVSAVQLEVSEDLKNWRPYSAFARLKESTNSELIFELDAEGKDAERLFFRARYEP